MPYQYFPSEFNVWPKERGPQAPESATPVPSAMLPRGPTVVDQPMPADEANAERSKMVPPPAKESKLVHIYPRSMPGGQPVAVSIYSYPQLDRMSVAGIKLIATNLRDRIEETGVLTDLPPLMVSSQPDVVINWSIDVQIRLAKVAGQDVTPASFGVGNDLDRPSV